MRAYKYEFNSRVWVPGLNKVQGIVIEQRGHAFKGNSYLVTWHELTAAGIEIKEQVFTEADIETADIDRVVVDHRFNHDEVVKWAAEEAARLKSESDNGWRDWPPAPPVGASPKITVKRAASRKRAPAKRSKRRARR